MESLLFLGKSLCMWYKRLHGHDNVAHVFVSITTIRFVSGSCSWWPEPDVCWYTTKLFVNDFKKVSTFFLVFFLNIKVRFMVVNTTFNNISCMLWWSVLLVEQTGVTEENHRPVTSHWQTLSHNVESRTPRMNRV